MIVYPGYIPSNVARDAKYSVVYGSGGRMEVRLIYRVSAGERLLLTTDRHDELVDMVNAAKIEGNGDPGGVFYINEFRDVIVPTAKGPLYAGNYPTDLVFEFEGTSIGPRAPGGVEPGDMWPGPHVGIRYVLTADGRDIKFSNVVGNRELTEFLSRHTSSAAATQLARRLGALKGMGGGRVYINEAMEFFSPVDKEDRIDYVYLGSLDEDQWFEAPDVPRPGD